MLTLPNLLTLSRIFAVPILVFLLWRPAPLDYAITFVLYCVVGITDYFDGYLARAQGRISRLGRNGGGHIGSAGRRLALNHHAAATRPAAAGASARHRIRHTTLGRVAAEHRETTRFIGRERVCVTE